MKELIWKMLPAFIRKAWSKGTPSPYGWFGNYASWQEAEKEATGYDSTLILEKVRQGLRQVKQGKAAYERDSVVFEKLDYEPGVLQALNTIASAQQQSLDVADFGGSLGSSYFQYRQLLQCSIKRWTVIEQAHFVAAGKAEFEDGVLQFRSSLAETIAEGKPGAVLLFSVLPYLEKPYALLEELLSYDVEFLLIDRTPFVPLANDRLTLQKVPEFIYKASYPAWLFSEEKFLRVFQGKYEVVQRFSSKFAEPQQLSDGVRAEWKGFLLRKKQNV